MNRQKLLIANRGEIAIRISRAAAELNIESFAIYSEDDAASLHRHKADQALALSGKGVSAYLDRTQIITLAKQNGCEFIHPGYGFLSEDVEFAALCEKEGICFVGPKASTLELFADKGLARKLAEDCDVPVVEGTNKATSLEEAKAFFTSLQSSGAATRAMIIKAISGGGGRGMRIVHAEDEIEEAYKRCQSEAKASFDSDALYVERYFQSSRHIEVQIIADGLDASHLYERECSVQRRHQKLIEIAPSPSVSDETRARLCEAALRLAKHTDYKSLGTFEFLLEDDVSNPNPDFIFMEANPRLQVEHTVTEEVLGVDIVKSQIRIAQGDSLKDIGLTQEEITSPNGFAIQTRINMETMQADSTTLPTGGLIQAFDVPCGPGVRVDSMGYAGYSTSPNYDSLLAKVIVHSPSDDLNNASYQNAIAKAYRALCEFRIVGLGTNLSFIQNILMLKEFNENTVNTGFIETHLEALLKDGAHPQRYADVSGQLDGVESDVSKPTVEGALLAPLQGTIVCVDVAVGDLVQKGQQLMVMESMKMEHVIEAQYSGLVTDILVIPGDTIFVNHSLICIDEQEVSLESVESEQVQDLDFIRPDLQEVLERHAYGTDEVRTGAVAKRQSRGQRTAWVNVLDLCDKDSFVEYGGLTIAAQRGRRSLDDLMKNTPADGMLTGIASVNGDLFDEEQSQCVVMSYDCTVLAGTQGMQNHNKSDRMFQLAKEGELPVILFAEGGGGRPGDTDVVTLGGLDLHTWHHLGALSGKVPLVGITSGRCFAGNAAMLGCCHVIIATQGSNIGMGGPAMIEGGGLGAVTPEDIGPVEDQLPNGVIDILVKDEAEAVQVGKKYLSYFQGPIKKWEASDQRVLRTLIPENRLRIYDVRHVIENLADKDSVLEIRKSFGEGVITAFVRIEGRPLGVIANNPMHLSGAIDRDGSDKTARFMQLCDAFDIPMLSLIDTPGIMVGPESEKTALVRHASRLFVTAANMTIPFFSIVLRKGYGLGAMAMAGTGFKTPAFTISWPTGEFGGMGLEGAVKLGFKKELESIKDPVVQKATFDKMVEMAYERGKAANAATFFEFDDVIDPADSRRWILMGMKSFKGKKHEASSKRSFVDTW